MLSFFFSINQKLNRLYLRHRCSYLCTDAHGNEAFMIDTNSWVFIIFCLKEDRGYVVLISLSFELYLADIYFYEEYYPASHPIYLFC